MKLTLRVIEIEGLEDAATARALFELPFHPSAAAPPPRAIAAPSTDVENRAATSPPRRPVAVKNGKPPRRGRVIQPKENTDERSAPAQAAILELLARGPLTSAEIIARSKLSAASCYSILTVLRAAKRIETRDDGDGIRKNFAVA